MGSSGLREGLLASWRAAERQSTLTGELCLNYASAAGWLLAEFGTVAQALAHLPASPWWSTVAHYLRMVAIDEAPLARVRPVAGGHAHAIRR